MSAKKDPRVIELERVIAHNAKQLGEEPTLGVHVLGNGRVRIYRLSLGWRRLGYQQYRSLDAAVEASRVAQARADRTAAHVKEGWAVGVAVAMAKAEIQP